MTIIISFETLFGFAFHHGAGGFHLKVGWVNLSAIMSTEREVFRGIAQAASAETLRMVEEGCSGSCHQQKEGE